MPHECSCCQVSPLKFHWRGQHLSAFPPGPGQRLLPRWLQVPSKSTLSPSPGPHRRQEPLGFTEAHFPTRSDRQLEAGGGSWRELRAGAHPGPPGAQALTVLPLKSLPPPPHPRHKESLLSSCDTGLRVPLRVCSPREPSAGRGRYSKPSCEWLLKKNPTTRRCLGGVWGLEAISTALFVRPSGGFCFGHLGDLPFLDTHFSHLGNKPKSQSVSKWPKASSHLHAA